MAFQVSPGVLVQEKDLTNVIPAVATSIGAIAGQFVKGPIDEVDFDAINNEDQKLKTEVAVESVVIIVLASILG